MAKTLNEITEILKGHKKEICDKYNVKEIGVFGSFVRGEQKKSSDVDILVDFEEEDIPDLLTLIELELYIEKLLKRKVDLGLKRSIRRELRERILKEALYV